MEIVQATPEDAEAISRMCSTAWRETYQELFASEYIDRIVAEYYNLERITKEVTGPPRREWGGYIVAKENGEVVGAIGGGMTATAVGEVFVLYLNPARLGQGIGTQLLKALTEQQRGFGATEQWVSVEKRNSKGVPFYLAKGFVLRETEPRTADGAQTLRLWRSLEVT